MNTNHIYASLIQELKHAIINSRYQAMRLANREQPKLYYWIGKQLDEKISSEAWGSKSVGLACNRLTCRITRVAWLFVHKPKKHETIL